MENGCRVVQIFEDIDAKDGVIAGLHGGKLAGLLGVELLDEHERDPGFGVGRQVGKESLKRCQSSGRSAKADDGERRRLLVLSGWRCSGVCSLLSSTDVISAGTGSVSDCTSCESGGSCSGALLRVVLFFAM